MNPLTPILTNRLDAGSSALNVCIPGDILSTNADALRDELFVLLESPAIRASTWSTLKLDLTAAQMVDSMGLNLIVSVIRAIKAGNRKMEVLVRSANIHRTFLFTRLDRQIQVTKV